MDNQELADNLLHAWNRQAVAEILRLMDAQATYYDAFWGETCSGRDLVRYLDTQIAQDSLWYERNGELLDAPDGFVIRYIAYDRQNPRKREIKYSGAAVITVRDGKITGVSDFYCDPDPLQLVEVASRIERRHSESRVAHLGLSDRTAGLIRRRLAELGDESSIFLDPTLSARQLADRIGCTVAHLQHVLKEEENSSFPAFVNARRIKFAATLIREGTGGTFNLKQVAIQSGFDDTQEFDDEFASVFGICAEAYHAQKSLETAESSPDFVLDIGMTGTFNA